MGIVFAPDFRTVFLGIRVEQCYRSVLHSWKINSPWEYILRIGCTLCTSQYWAKYLSEDIFLFRHLWLLVLWWVHFFCVGFPSSPGIWRSQSAVTIVRVQTLQWPFCFGLVTSTPHSTLSSTWWPIKSSRWPSPASWLECSAARNCLPCPEQGTKKLNTTGQ